MTKNNTYKMEERIEYELDTGLYESFLDGLEKNYNIDNVNSLIGYEEEDSSSNGLFADFGFGVDDTIDLASPLSDSGISCSSSPYRDVGIEELEAGTWGNNGMEWSAFDMLTDAPSQEMGDHNELQNGIVNFESHNAIAIPVPDIDEQEAAILPSTFLETPTAAAEEEVGKNVPAAFNIGSPVGNATEPLDGSIVNAPLSIEVPETNVSFPESTPTLVSVNKQKMFIVKAVPVRSVPYKKSGKTKVKERSKEQKERKRGQNRNAALRYRNKKKEELDMLFDEAERIETANKELSEKVTEITKEIDYLKSLMLDVIKARLARNQTE
eukprot:gene9296-10277_t